MKTEVLRALVCATVALASASVLAQANVAERARKARKVVVATVVDVQSAFETTEAGDQLIMSTVHLRVDETLKGPFEPALTLKLEGGTVGDLTLEVSDLPAVKPGERAVLFLDQARAGEYVPHDRGDGVLRLDAGDRVRGANVTLNEIRTAVRGAGR